MKPDDRPTVAELFTLLKEAREDGDWETEQACIQAIKTGDYRPVVVMPEGWKSEQTK